MNTKAQVSVEYMLLLAAFFGILAITLPVTMQTAQDFLSSSDNLLAKRISEELKEEINLQTFLGNGSSKIMEYSPAKTLTIYSQGSQVVIEGKGKTYLVETSFPQLIIRQELSTKFIVQVKKENGKIIVSVSG